MAELTQEEVETVAEAVPQIVEGLTKIKVGFGLLGAAIGAAVGGLVAERVLRGKYERLAEEEIAQMREHFHAKVVAMEGKPALDGLVRDLGYVPTAEDAAKSAEESTPSDPGAPNTTVETKSVMQEAIEKGQEIAEEEKNVFEEAQKRLEVVDPHAGWDYQTEIARRSGNAPYVIHEDEQHEKGYNEATFTYYEGDDVLCDEGDRIVDDRDKVIGADFVDKFGHGSSDPNVVYIRNEDLEVEIEVCRSPNSYAEEVHGLKHADEIDYRRPRRYSSDDE